MSIRERLDRDLITDVAGLTRPEQDELLLWAREKGIKWDDIRRKFKFKVKESTLRGRHRILKKNRPPRKAIFTERDVSYLTLRFPSFLSPTTLHRYLLPDAKMAN